MKKTLLLLTAILAKISLASALDYYLETTLTEATGIVGETI